MIQLLTKRLPGWIAAGWILAVVTAVHGAELKTRNVFLIVSDGFRWQEVFGGAEELLLIKDHDGKTNAAHNSEFWRPTPAERRQALLPFIWGEMARKGQIFGNQNKGSIVTVTNGNKFSYPGYNEMLTGSADHRINSNNKRPNPNVTVFEWLNSRTGLQGRTMVLATWDVFPYIFNIGRSHLPIWPAWEDKFAAQEIKTPAGLDELVDDTLTPWNDGVTYDPFLFQAAMDCIPRQRPRLVFVGFGETDEWGHLGRYDRYLSSAHHVDRFVRQLWNALQTMPDYQGKTTFIITADHGRGSGPENWKHHAANIAGAEGDWIAVIGPDTPPLGERTETKPHTESQMASTIAALLGEDYCSAHPEAAEPIADILGGP